MKICKECFGELNSNGTCAECTSEEVFEAKQDIKKPRGKWEPNIKPNEKWFKVPSDFTAYKVGE